MAFGLRASSLFGSHAGDFGSHAGDFGSHARFILGASRERIGVGASRESLPP